MSQYFELTDNRDLGRSGGLSEKMHEKSQRLQERRWKIIHDREK